MEGQVRAKPGPKRSDLCSICKERPKAWKTSSYCRECAREERRARDQANREKVQMKNRTTRDRRRKAVHDLYGNRCACCGENDQCFLSLDHVDNDGAEERRQGVSIWTIHTRILSGEWTSRFQLLCWNCNRGKWAYGECPHVLRARGITPTIIAERHHRKNAPDLVVA